MPIALITGPANAGKARLVLDAMRAHVARGEDALLVVPTEADQARYRRELAEGGPALGGRVERFEGLLGEVLARAGSTEVPLGTLAREQVLGRLANARPGMASVLAKFVAELETQRVTPRGLGEALQRWGSTAERQAGGRATLERLCAVFEDYQQTLVKLRRSDRELRIAGALDRLRRTPSLWGEMPVLLYGFDDLTEPQLDAIETLGAVVGAKVTLSLAYEPGRVVFAGRAGTFQRLAPLAETHTALPARAEHYTPRSRVALHHLERSLLAEEPLPGRVAPGEAVRLLEGGSPRAELELVAGEVRALLELGVQEAEIAIVHRAPEAIGELIGEVLEDFDVPYAQHRPVSFSHTAIGRGLLGLLRCAVGDGQLGDLLAWLRAPGVLDRLELADRLEADARRAGAVSGDGARALWEAEHWPLERIDRVRDMVERDIPALADTLTTELERLFCAPRRGVAAVLDEDDLDEALALRSARRALEELRELARLAPELAPTPAELIDVLGRLQFAGARRMGTPGVAIVDPLALRARRVRMVFACGMQEGVFPAPAISHPLLGEEDRRQLAQASGLALRGAPDALAAERYLLYALSSRAEERLTLSWHTADESGRPLARSLFVEDVCELFTEALEQRIVRRFAGDTSWPGPGPAVGAVAGREVDSGAVGGREVDSGAVAGREVPSGRAPAGMRPRPIDRLGHELVLDELRERELWSASSLETWAGCPVKWFVERLLHAGSIDPDPEPLARGGLAHEVLKETLERLRARGGSARLTPASLELARELLRETLEERSERSPLSVAPERVPGARRRLQVELERYLEHAARLESPLEPTYLELEFGFDGRASGARGMPPSERGTPASERGAPASERGAPASERGAPASERGAPASERGNLASETPGPETGVGGGCERHPDGPLPAVPIGEGVLLRGRIDRVDLAPSGEAVVYDYKSRSAPPGAKWVGDGAFQMALYMRAVERLLGRPAIGGFYQPLAGRDIRARGALDCESGVELDCVRTDRREHEDFGELVEQCVQAALRAAAQARSGALEPRPGSCAYRGGCTYPTICRCEL